MSSRILKYHLDVTREAQPIVMKAGARVVAVDNQHEHVTLWAETDDEAEPATLIFYVVGTGWDVPSNCDHRGTAILLGGQYVWHVYEARPAPVLAELVPEFR